MKPFIEAGDTIYISIKSPLLDAKYYDLGDM